jgi:hypothetical protein
MTESKTDPGVPGPPIPAPGGSEEQATILKMFEAYQELKRLGWNDIQYCPKDGTWFYVLEIGSTGIHKCYYEGEWPSGHWWIAEAGDLWPSRPVLFRLKAQAAAR